MVRVNLSRRQMIADYTDRWGSPPDRDEPPPESGDVDPRAQVENCYSASDKAIAIGGGVLQAILEYTGVLRGVAGRNALEV